MEPILKVDQSYSYDEKNKPIFEGYFCHVDGLVCDYIFVGRTRPTKKTAILEFREMINKGLFESKKEADKYIKMILENKAEEPYRVDIHQEQFPTAKWYCCGMRDNFDIVAKKVLKLT